MKKLWLGILLSLATSSLAFADNSFHTGIAMDGDPKYADGFAHFDYVNPDAPKGGELRLNKNGTFDSFNPFNVIGQPAARVDALIYQSLMTRSWDEPFSLYGLLAESVEVADDRSSIIFTLRPEARWSDGLPVTADDVLFSFITLRDKGRPNHRTYYKKVDKAEKLDERHVKFTFKHDINGTIDRELPLLIGLMPILPEHDWKDRAFDRTTLRLPIGSGPYVISAYDPGRSITYSRKPDYWGRDLPEQKGLHNFNKIRIDYYRDENIAIEAFIGHQYDLRSEADPNKWATAYDFPAALDGRVKLEPFPHHRPEPAEGFVFNTRRAPFKDPALRAALEYTFDSEWINRNLFHSQYHRSDSFYANSELAAPVLPIGKELEILKSFGAQIPPSLLSEPVTPPSTDGGEKSFRDNLLKATAILKAAGYTWRNEKLYAPNASNPVTFQILLNDSANKKIALTWINALRQLGIDATVPPLVDSAAYQSRLSNFDFDVIIYKWINTLSPGNEQTIYWGSSAADQNGSRNYAGIKDPIIDALTNAIPATTTREDLVATVHALDRVLMAGHYTIPFYYIGADDYVYWTGQLRHPAVTSLYGIVLESWWSEDNP